MLYSSCLKLAKYWTKNQIILHIINQLKERTDPDCSLKWNHAIDTSIKRLIEKATKENVYTKRYHKNQTWIESKLKGYKANFAIISLNRKKCDSESIHNVTQNSSQLLKENEIPKQI